MRFEYFEPEEDFEKDMEQKAIRRHQSMSEEEKDKNPFNLENFVKKNEEEEVIQEPVLDDEKSPFNLSDFMTKEEIEASKKLTVKYFENDTKKVLIYGSKESLDLYKEKIEKTGVYKEVEKEFGWATTKTNKIYSSEEKMLEDVKKMQDLMPLDGKKLTVIDASKEKALTSSTTKEKTTDLER